MHIHIKVASGWFCPIVWTETPSGLLQAVFPDPCLQRITGFFSNFEECPGVRTHDWAAWTKKMDPTFAELSTAQNLPRTFEISFLMPVTLILS